MLTIYAVEGQCVLQGGRMYCITSPKRWDILKIFISREKAVQFSDSILDYADKINTFEKYNMVEFQKQWILENPKPVCPKHGANIRSYYEKYDEFLAKEADWTYEYQKGLNKFCQENFTLPDPLNLVKEYHFQNPYKEIQGKFKYEFLRITEYQVEE